MADGAKTVEVNLLGRTYRVACDDGEREALMQAVAYLDAKMNEIRKAGKVMGSKANREGRGSCGGDCA